MARTRRQTSSRKGRISDARGRKVTQLDPVSMHMLRRHDRITADELTAIVDTIDPQVRRGLKLGLWLIAAIAVLTVGVLAMNIVMEGGDAWRDLVSTLMNPVFISAVLLPGLIVGVIVPVAALHWRCRLRVRWAMLRNRRCPHCGYDLNGLPVDETDGATVCPECGCAWILDQADQTEDADSA